MKADPDPHEALARGYQHRVGFFARKVARTYMMGERYKDELISAGYWGLAKALQNRREDASERELSAYVSTRIVGAVIDEARQCISRSASGEVAMPSWTNSDSGEPEPDRFLDSVADPGQSPEDLTSRMRVRDRISDVLDVLDDPQRRLVEAYMDGATIREIAESEGVPVGTLRTRFQKAVRLLRGSAPEIRSELREHS